MQKTRRYRWTPVLVSALAAAALVTATAIARPPASISLNAPVSFPVDI